MNKIVKIKRCTIKMPQAQQGYKNFIFTYVFSIPNVLAELEESLSTCFFIQLLPYFCATVLKIEGGQKEKKTRTTEKKVLN